MKFQGLSLNEAMATIERIRLANIKLAKMSLPGLTYTKQAVRHTPILHDPHTDYTLEIMGDMPMVADHTFVASLEHVRGSDQNIVRSLSDIDLSQFHTRRTCDHCKVNRYRSNSYIFKTPSGDLIQVGSACLKLYFNRCVSELLAYAACLEDIEERDSIGYYYAPYFELSGILSLAIADISNRGFVSAKSEDKLSTKQAVIFHLQRAVGYEITVTQEHIIEADKQIAWLKSQEPSSEYMRSLIILTSLEAVEFKHIGFIASIPAAYDKAIQSAKQLADQPASDYVGNEGDKISLPVVVDRLVLCETNYGVSTLILMTDKAGNKLSWFASNAPALEIGQEITIKGTIKAHDDYKGIKQTKLTRCKVA